MVQRKVQAAVRWEFTPLIVLVLINLTIGVVISPDYGIGLDEAGDVQYGIDALASYPSNERNWEWYGTRKYYGPAYLMTQEWLTSHLSKIFPTWSAIAIRHFIIYAVFQVAIVSLYLFLRRFFSRLTTLTVSLLFALQPLYFGHAFINGKDIPFLSMFLLTMVLGITASDRLVRALGSGETDSSDLYRELITAIRKDWGVLPQKTRWVILLGVTIPLLLAVDLFITKIVLIPMLNNIVTSIYNHQAWGPLNDLFDSVALNKDSLPASAYAEKAARLLLRASMYLFLVYLPVLFWAGWRYFRQTRSMLQDDIRSLPVQTLPRSFFLALLIFGSIAMGLTTSVRIAGFLAGFLVSLIFILRHRGRAFLPLLIYWSTGILIAYLSWPFLWGDPVRRLGESLAIMANHPWRGYVLYMGEVTKGRLLEWYFLPQLMLTQFTEPTWLLFFLSIPGMFVRSIRKRLPASMLIILLIWYCATIVPMSVREVWLYDNFRQFLFVTPPIFIFGALGLEWIFQVTRQPVLRGFIVLLVVLPGILGIVNLHPYQYIYYNSLVGGVDGAAGRYELDYWCTSYSEAMQKLNAVLPLGSSVAFRGSTSAAAPFARPDITIFSISSEEDVLEQQPDVVAVCSRANTYQVLLADYPVFAEISVQNVPLVIIRKIAP